LWFLIGSAVAFNCTLVATVARDYLTDFELMLLLATLRVGDEAYGVTIAREIEASGERSVMLGAVYTGLDRLEANGLVASTVGAPTPERGGRAKRYFRVTPAGLKAIRQAKRSFTRLWSGIPALEGGRT
jgi:PadR family transcriptional regulator, regulatory protein PadR